MDSLGNVLFSIGSKPADVLLLNPGSLCKHSVVAEVYLSASARDVVFLLILLWLLIELYYLVISITNKWSGKVL